ncbi:MAG: hypothetical protein WBC85_09255 [Planktotalea sp.]|uniref:hypothetical protein n=1 Tax=Planktotalea sp. TaxID=2029877 RepID=UPI003C75DA1D
MPFNSIGDLASSMMLSHSNLQAKRTMMRLSQELTTGITSDVGGALRHDYSAQMGWERSIASSQVREKTLAEAMTRIQAKQTVLDTLSQSVTDLANNTSLALTAGTTAGLDSASAHAKSALDQALAHLNMQSAGHSLFAGAASDGPAIADTDTILASVKAAVVGAVTVSDVISSVQAWMDDTVNGFPAVAYLGSEEPSGTIRIDGNRTLTEGLRADDPAIKGTLQNLIMASLATDQDLALSRENKSAVLQQATNGLRAADGQITQLQAALGHTESEIAGGLVQAGAEISTAELLRAQTLGIDQYETASKLQEAELQLEKIYMLTARSAQMSLLEYLR